MRHAADARLGPRRATAGRPAADGRRRAARRAFLREHHGVIMDDEFCPVRRPEILHVDPFGFAVDAHMRLGDRARHVGQGDHDRVGFGLRPGGVAPEHHAACEGNAEPVIEDQHDGRGGPWPTARGRDGSATVDRTEPERIAVPSHRNGGRPHATMRGSLCTPGAEHRLPPRTSRAITPHDRAVPSSARTVRFPVTRLPTARPHHSHVPS